MRLSHLPIVLLGSLLPLLAQAGRDPVPPTGIPRHLPPYVQQWAKVEVFDRTAGYTLPLYYHEQRLYVAGEPGHQYELRITNRSDERVLAVTSVDGVNVITGKTADEGQTGYVLDPWGGVGVEGWRKSLDEVATFYFTRLANSYAARTGRPHNVGVIGVAVFRERRPCCQRHSFEDHESEDPVTAAAPQEPSARAETQSADEEPSRRSRDKLGTGHGHREASPAQYTDFRRASNAPEETIVIYYDSRKNLVAQGVIRDSHRYAEERRPNPFPEGMFVPDP